MMNRRNRLKKNAFVVLGNALQDWLNSSIRQLKDVTLYKTYLAGRIEYYMSRAVLECQKNEFLQTINIRTECRCVIQFFANSVKSWSLTAKIKHGKRLWCWAQKRSTKSLKTTHIFSCKVADFYMFMQATILLRKMEVLFFCKHNPLQNVFQYLIIFKQIPKLGCLRDS